MSKVEPIDEFNKDEPPKVVSNYINGEYIDRIYGGGFLPVRLVQKDGTTYNGSITKKSITKIGIHGDRFKSHVYVTEDGRWFDRCGMPIPKPEKEEQDVEEE
jgi:hypothetical protein